MTPPKQRASGRGVNVLGGKIRKARLKCNPKVSQMDLAARLSVRGVQMDRPTVTRIENCERYLRDFEIKEIARALNVSVAWLFGEAR
jgi:transcriptional regulator with XRE-family HTH domain